MLSKEDNELLTRTGPGTPMGDLLRQYWIPVFLSSELPEPDGPPLRTRLLCEDLIAFRDTSGRVGMLGEHCAHRGASLFFGRNEERGLRCVYHGWKYDLDGRCMDMPNEPEPLAGDQVDVDAQNGATPMGAAPRRFKDKIRLKAYPCREHGGVIWTYMGQRQEPPSLPQLEWAMVPDDHRALSKFLRECNWVQALEGDIDTAHLYILHRRLDPEADGGVKSGDTGVYHEDVHPHLELVPTEYGMMYGARRAEGPDHYYWRITQFMFPFHTFFPPGGFPGVPGHIWVPMDDENTMVWSLTWNPSDPLPQGQSARVTAGGRYLPFTSDPLGRWRLAANKDNDYLIDREVQRTKTFTGIPTIPLQDQAMTESMGPIVDRTQEHLASTDAMVIQVRNRLINAAKALREQGETPPCVDDSSLYGVRSVSVVLPRDADWKADAKDLVKAFSGLPVSTG